MQCKIMKSDRQQYILGIARLSVALDNHLWQMKENNIVNMSGVGVRC